MTKNVIKIGMVGTLDVDNDPVLRALQSQKRMHLSAAFSPVYANVESFSRNHQASPFGSLRCLVEHDAIQGLIWNKQLAEIDLVKWAFGTEPKPILARQQFLEHCSIESLVRLRNRAAAEHVVILPELLHRWTPATLRLRELIATELGPIHRITMTVQYNNRASQIHSIDWIRTMLAIREVNVVFQGENQSINIEFARHNGLPAICRLNLLNESFSESLTTNENASIRQVECEGGMVEISSDDDLRWRTNEDWIVEHLESDRSAADVMPDLFGRRIVGGIVPVPDLNEYLRSYRLLTAIRDSQKTGNAINIDDASVPIDHGELSF